MDIISHAAWGYLIWYDSPFTWLAVVACMLPDLVSVIPSDFATLVKNKFNYKAALKKKNQPEWAAVYSRLTWAPMHSIVVASAVWALVAVIWSPQWWLLGWHFHIIIDIFTHPREPLNERTPFLWPVSNLRGNGFNWSSRKFIIGNALLLLITAVFVIK